MTPRTALTARVPAPLYGRKRAAETWRRLIGLYDELDAPIVTAFDQDLLITYCVVLEEILDELPALKETAIATYHNIEQRMRGMENEDALFKLTGELIKLLKEIKGIDARLDVKRKLLHTLQQSLYITPRSRAGVSPPEKDPEAPLDDMEKLLQS